MSAENWLPVRGYEGSYEVGDLGHVRSVERTITYRDGRVRVYPGQTLKPGRDGGGHLHVILYQNHVAKIHRVHRLVAEHFVPGQAEGLEVCHWDDDKENNAASNLRWDTDSANKFDGVRNGRNHNASKVQCIHGHPFVEDNIYRNALGQRRCKTCAKDASARQRARQKPVAA